MKGLRCVAATVWLGWLAATSMAHAATGFRGAWTAKVPGPSGQSGLQVTFTFTIQDGKPGGSVSTGDRSFALVDVKIDESAITFAIEGEEQNKYSGTLSGDEIKMQVKYPSHENGTRVWSFVAKRVSASESAVTGAAAVDGDWEGGVPRGGGRVIEARFTLHVDGEILSGNVYAVGDVFPIEKGKIAGNSIAFRIAGTQGDYSGIVDADEIQMKVKYDGGESGRQTLRFALKRAKN